MGTNSTTHGSRRGEQRHKQQNGKKRGSALQYGVKHTWFTHYVDEQHCSTCSHNVGVHYRNDVGARGRRCPLFNTLDVTRHSRSGANSSCNPSTVLELTSFACVRKTNQGNADNGNTHDNLTPLPDKLQRQCALWKSGRLPRRSARATFRSTV